MSTPPIQNDERLYRQIGHGGNPIFFDPNNTPPVHYAVFLPSKSDDDGLSLIRSRFRTEVWSAFRAEQPDTRFRLAVLQAGGLGRTAEECQIGGINYRASPDGLDRVHGEPWAHCVASETNRKVYESDREARRRIKEWAQSVARSISTNHVVGPFDEPAKDDPYRPD